MKWTTVRVSGARAHEEIVRLLVAEGASCVQEDGGSLVTSFPDEAIPANLEGRVRALDPVAVVLMSEMPEQSYDLHGSVTARRIGDLFVVPPWDSESYPGARTIIIEPGGAFGTGDHATTRGVLLLLQEALREGDIVADLGAGSAVLSIAAAKLGAARVAAVELDHDAMANAEENVAANAVGDIVTVIEGDAETLLPLLAPVNVILANIVSGVLIPMLPLIRRSLAVNGSAILSGILVAERDKMVDAFSENDMVIEKAHSEEEWWSALIRPR